MRIRLGKWRLYINLCPKGQSFYPVITLSEYLENGDILNSWAYRIKI